MIISIHTVVFVNLENRSSYKRWEYNILGAFFETGMVSQSVKIFMQTLQNAQTLEWFTYNANTQATQTKASKLNPVEVIVISYSHCPFGFSERKGGLRLLSLLYFSCKYPPHSKSYSVAATAPQVWVKCRGHVSLYIYRGWSHLPRWSWERGRQRDVLPQYSY